ncbi:MAG: MotA/TolQ/ExbB proton channel family protein [Pseudodesulfovibrio sp.]|nr:MotA/TolQ/ExbB proton channel family protein [Pseudodesulfovibrio sp.]
MDIATLIGLSGALGLVVTTVFMGGNAAGFVDVPSMVVVVGGTFAVTFVMFPMGVVIGTIKVGMKTLLFKSNDPQEIVLLITSLADKARKESLIALEKVNIDDEFLKKGVMLVVDGASEALVRSVMEIELEFMKQRHRQGQAVFKGMGNMAPAFGMIGTLIGLVNMLSNLSDPASIGPAMAVALLTTFYGAVMANCIFLPMATKLAERSAEDALFMQIMVEGVSSLQRGDHPSVVKEKLQAFLSPAMREKTS